MKQSRFTLQDVADRAGVSIATASRAISDGKVRAATRERVEQAIRDLKYSPNAAARTLRGEKSMTVGVVFNQISGSLATEMLDALASALYAVGYSLFVATAQGSEQQYDELVRRFAERRVDALICVNAMGEGASLASIRALRIPAVAVFGGSGGYRDLPLVEPTIRAITRQCAERLKALGHESVGLVFSARTRPLAAFRRFAKETGLTVRSFDLAGGEVDAVSFLNRLMLDPDRATALIAHQHLAVQLFAAADEMSVLVPKDVSLISIRDHTAVPAVTRLALSTLHLDPGRVGAETARRLIKVLRDGEPESVLSWEQVEMGAWIERATTGPRPN